MIEYISSALVSSMKIVDLTVKVLGGQNRPTKKFGSVILRIEKSCMAELLSSFLNLR